MQSAHQPVFTRCAYQIINTFNDLNLTHTLQPLQAISHKRSFIRHELYYESPHTNGFYYLYKVPL